MPYSCTHIEPQPAHPLVSNQQPDAKPDETELDLVRVPNSSVPRVNFEHFFIITFYLIL